MLPNWQFRFSPATTIICAILALLMVRASFWQWSRYEQKKRYISTLEIRLKQPPAPLSELIPPEFVTMNDTAWNDLISAKLLHRRVLVSGQYDFDREIVLRNRRLKQVSGVHVITPLLLDNSGSKFQASDKVAVLVDRGFIPLSKASSRERVVFHRESRASLVALIKEPSRQRFWAPADPPSGPNLPWVDAWLRVDTGKISKQLPYKIFPFYLEIIQSGDVKAIEDEIIDTSSGRDEIFVMGSEKQLQGLDSEPDLDYPVPTFSTVVSAGRHFGYIFEWAFMALITILIAIVLQFRRSPCETG